MSRLTQQIVGLLGVTSAPADSLSQFEAWVATRTARVQSAAAAGQPGLRDELAQLRAELMEARSIESPALRRSEELWLLELIELVGEVMPPEPRASELCACA